MVTVVETMLAILDADVRVLQNIFFDFVTSGFASGNLAGCEVSGPVAQELCYALYDDVSPMPRDLCTHIGVPEGSTYARGANRLLETFADGIQNRTPPRP